MSKPYKPAVYREQYVRKPTVYRPRTATEEIAAIDSGIPPPPDIEAYEPRPTTESRWRRFWNKIIYVD